MIIHVQMFLGIYLFFMMIQTRNMCKKTPSSKKVFKLKNRLIQNNTEVTKNYMISHIFDKKREFFNKKEI